MHLLYALIGLWYWPDVHFSMLRQPSRNKQTHLGLCANANATAAGAYISKGLSIDLLSQPLVVEGTPV